MLYAYQVKDNEALFVRPVEFSVFLASKIEPCSCFYLNGTRVGEFDNFKLIELTPYLLEDKVQTLVNTIIEINKIYSDLGIPDIYLIGDAKPGMRFDAVADDNTPSFTILRQGYYKEGKHGRKTFLKPEKITLEGIPYSRLFESHDVLINAMTNRILSNLLANQQNTFKVILDCNNKLEKINNYLNKIQSKCFSSNN